MTSVPRLLVTRGLRGFIDGVVSVLLAGYLTQLGLSPVAVGAIVTGTLFGSGALTLGVGLVAHRFSTRRLLLLSAGLMVATGLAFAAFDRFWPLFIVGVVGTLNPSSGDVSVFLPVEQAVLASSAFASRARTALFARYNVVGTLSGAIGALVAGVPELLAHDFDVGVMTSERGVFLVYAAIGLVTALIYARLPSEQVGGRAPRPLSRSRSVVLRLAALFSLDAFGGGFVVQSLLAMWLFQRFHLSLYAAGFFFFASNVAGALSQFLSPRVAARIGLVRTMVYTHVPANLFLIAAGLMPSLGPTVVFLLLRASVSSMDVPARQAYVMAVVPPEERAAAASVTNVPRSVASAIAPMFTGMMLERTSFGWPLICAGALKLAYDFLLFARFRASDADPRVDLVES
jgi:MFS family permease